MRMRKKKNGPARVEACSDLLIKTPEEISLYRDKFPVDVEIGCGKGGFICATALSNPDRFYIAVELITDALISALETAKEKQINNVRFINTDAKNLTQYFQKGDISTLYLNFSDPWPKSRHEKRRLTYRTFLEEYIQMISDNGKIEFKTDNRALFDFSLAEFEAVGLRVCDVTYDLHNSEYAAANIMTEYEKNFSQKGFTINRAVAYLK